MKYTGINKEGFERDARLFNEWREADGMPSYAPTADEIDREARYLANAYGIGHAEIWDYLAEYEEEKE